MRKLITILFVIIGQVSFGQVYQIMPQYGYSAPRFNTDSTLQLPTFNGVPTLKSNKTNKGAIAIDSTNGRFYFYNPKTSAWSQVSGGGGSTDTTSLSNRINLKLNISDTSNMLSKYLRKTDTTSISNRINLKVNIADTSTMLTSYLKKVDTTNKFVSNVTRLDDSTITIFKGSTQTNITLRPSTTVASATRLVTNVYNNSGATITKGSVIYINGAHSSNLPTIALSKANAEETSAYTYGLVETDITNNSAGVVIQNGSITNLNLPTSTYTDGQTLYLSPTVAGGYTLTKPLAPYHYVAIGTVTRAHPTFGTIQISIRNGFQLDELSDVQIALVPIDSTILQFSRVDSLWHDVNPTTAMGNRFVKRTDSAAMLLPYLRKTDTATLSNRINLKLNIADTSTMLNPYLRKSDTSTLSTRINTKLAITDTSTLQSKSLASYTFQANNTTATANASAQTFRDSAQRTYSGTITWTGTGPTGATNHSYHWSQIGKLVTLRINLVYATAGTATAVNISLPSDCPTPELPTGLSGADRILGFCTGFLVTSTNSNPTTAGATVANFKINSANNGYEFYLVRGSASIIAAYLTVSYFAQ